jgi:3-oxoacyl-[acyl-carrier-protein] synthase II
MTERIVISGLGLLSPNGMDKDAFRDGLRAGKSGIRRISNLDVSLLQTKVAGFIDDALLEPLFPDKESPKRLDRTGVFSLIAAQRAAADARIPEGDESHFKKGVVLGTACGPAAAIEEAYGRFFAEKASYYPPTQVPKTQTHSAACEVSSRLGLRKITQTVCAGSASSLAALIMARSYILSGAADIVFVGGVDCPLQQHYYRLWDARRVLTRDFNDEPERASRPFADRRSGFVLSEGCGFVVLEREGSALERNADVYAEVLGAGQTFSGSDETAARIEAQALCMDEAIADAQIPKDAVDHIQAHASGSPLGDLIETAAIKQTFRSQANDIPVSAIKAMIGHTLGASGVLALIAALLGMRNGFIPPTINLEEPDPRCDLDLVRNTVREQPFQTALINTFGASGTNVSVVVSSKNVRGGARVG